MALWHYARVTQFHQQLRELRCLKLVFCLSFPFQSSERLLWIPCQSKQGKQKGEWRSSVQAAAASVTIIRLAMMSCCVNLETTRNSVLWCCTPISRPCHLGRFFATKLYVWWSASVGAGCSMCNSADEHSVLLFCRFAGFWSSNWLCCKWKRPNTQLNLFPGAVIF